MTRVTGSRNGVKLSKRLLAWNFHRFLTEGHIQICWNYNPCSEYETPPGYAHSHCCKRLSPCGKKLQQAGYISWLKIWLSWLPTMIWVNKIDLRSNQLEIHWNKDLLSVHTVPCNLGNRSSTTANWCWIASLAFAKIHFHFRVSLYTFSENPKAERGKIIVEWEEFYYFTISKTLFYYFTI